MLAEANQRVRQLGLNEPRRGRVTDELGDLARKGLGTAKLTDDGIKQVLGLYPTLLLADQLAQ